MGKILWGKLSEKHKDIWKMFNLMNNQTNAIKTWMCEQAFPSVTPAKSTVIDKLKSAALRGSKPAPALVLRASKSHITQDSGTAACSEM